MANGTPSTPNTTDTGTAEAPGLPPGMSAAQFFGDRPGEPPAIQPPPTPPGEATGFEAGFQHYLGAFNRGAYRTLPVAAGTVALSAAASGGPGVVAGIPAAGGEILLGGLGGVAEQVGEDYGHPNLGTAAGTALGFMSAGLPSLYSRAGMLTSGLGAVASNFADIGKIASGDLLARMIGESGMAHLTQLAGPAIAATGAAGLYALGAGAKRVLENPTDWGVIAKPLAAYMGTGDWLNRYTQGARALPGQIGGYINSLMPGASAATPAAATPPPASNSLTSPQGFQPPPGVGL